MFSGAGDAFSRRRWPLSATSSSTCISLLSFHSSSRALLSLRSLLLSIGASMVASRPKGSSTSLFYGDSRFVNLCRFSTCCLTIYLPPHLGLRSESSNRRSVYFNTPLSMSLRLEDPHRSPSISLQAHSHTTNSDVLTGVSGIPHKTRSLDPNLFQVRVMCSPAPISLTTAAAGLLREIDETFSTDETSAAVLPQPLHSSISFDDLRYYIGGVPSAVPMTCIPCSSAASHHVSSASFHQQGHDPTFLKLGLHILILGLASPMVLNYKWPSLLLSQSTRVWGLLISLINCLKTSDGFNGVFTEADLHTMHYLSCAKSLISNHLPVGSPGLPSPPLASVLLKKRIVLSNVSLLKSVSLPNVKWKCLPISITVLLSCGAVRSGPEDATDFVSTILRGADWVLTSPLNVTILQLSNSVVKAISTHLSLVLNPLSSSHEELSSLFAFGIDVYLFDQRGWVHSLLLL